MNVVFRVDASPVIGAGHLMRCLSLASVLAEQGDRVGFCCRALPESYKTLVMHHSYRLFNLEDLNDDNFEDDANSTTASVLDFQADWVVVDHYLLGTSWERVVKQTGIPLLAVDDLPGRLHCADLLLDQNWVGDDTAYSAYAPEATSLLGPKYALLRKQFQEIKPPDRGTQLKRVLISFGGSDPSNQTEKAIEALHGEPIERLEVVVGGASLNADRIRQICRQFPHANFHLQHDTMAKLMASVDLGIGSPGSTTWERSCVGLPALVIVQAQNQLAVAESGEKLGVHRCLGWDSKVRSQDIRRSFRCLRQRPQELQEMSRRGRSAVDGKGAERVAERLRQWIRK